MLTRTDNTNNDFVTANANAPTACDSRGAEKALSGNAKPQHSVSPLAAQVDAIMRAGFADLLFSDPLRVGFDACELDDAEDDEKALALVREALPFALDRFAKSKGEWHRLRRPKRLVPLADGRSWMPLNCEDMPLGCDLVSNYDPLDPEFAPIAWEFDAEFNAACRLGGGPITIHRGAGYDARVGRILARTVDPIRCLETLVGPPVQIFMSITPKGHAYLAALRAAGDRTVADILAVC